MVDKTLPTQDIYVARVNAAAQALVAYGFMRPLEALEAIGTVSTSAVQH